MRMFFLFLFWTMISGRTQTYNNKKKCSRLKTQQKQNSPTVVLSALYAYTTSPLSDWKETEKFYFCAVLHVKNCVFFVFVASGFGFWRWKCCFHSETRARGEKKSVCRNREKSSLAKFVLMMDGFLGGSGRSEREAKRRRSSVRMRRVVIIGGICYWWIRRDFSSNF